MPTTSNPASSASKGLSRRKSIHPDENDEEEGKEKQELVKKCEICSEIFLEKDGEVQTKLTKEDLEKWTNLERNKINATKQSTDNVPSIYPFICQTCAPPADPGSEQPNRNTENKSGGILFKYQVPLGIFVVVIAIIIGHFVYDHLRNREKPFGVNMHKSSEQEQYLETQIYNLEKMYTYQEENVWYTLVAGIKKVTRETPNQPAVFLFIYDNDSAEKTAKCVAKAASKAAIKYLMQKEKEPLMHTGADFNTPYYLEDSGRLLVALNRTVREKGAMVVTKLQDIPPEVAKSLHFFCDVYSPLIEKAVYFFTLKVDGVPKYKKSQTAENKLKELWSEHMPEGSDAALITRMTPSVVGIKSDYSNC